ncbi:MAG: hypothetical protein ACI91B_004212 [Planctomycetota bacterium]|jgi:hypothetical protein
MIRQGELAYDQPAANAFTLCWLANKDSSTTKLADATTITKALAAKHLAAGDEQGSWHPIGVCGEAGGRAWTTAMAVLTLEAPYRYAKIVGR